MKKPKNADSKFLLGDNLKSDAKMAKAASDIFVKSNAYRRSRSEKSRASSNSTNTSQTRFFIPWPQITQEITRSFQDISSKDKQQQQSALQEE